MPLSDERTLSLFEKLQELKAQAVAGQPNQAVLKLMDWVLLSPDMHRRQRNFSLLLEQLRPEDAPLMHKFFQKLHREGRPFEEYSEFAQRWGEVDPQGAIAYLTAQPEPLPARDFHNLIKGWGNKSPESLIAWAEANPDMLTQYGGQGAFLEGVAKNSPQLATNWLAQHQDLPSRQFGEAVSGAYISTLYRDGVSGVTQWLASLPDTEAFQSASKQAWHDHVGRLTLLGGADAATLRKAVGDKPWAGIQELNSLLRNNYEGVSTNAAKMEALAGPDLTRQFERWATADPERVSRWLATQSAAMNDHVPPAFRNSAIQGLVNSLKGSDPEAAAVWERQLVK